MTAIPYGRHSSGAHSRSAVAKGRVRARGESAREASVDGAPGAQRGNRHRQEGQASAHCVDHDVLGSPTQSQNPANAHGKHAARRHLPRDPFSLKPAVCRETRLARAMIVPITVIEYCIVTKRKTQAFLRDFSWSERCMGPHPNADTSHCPGEAGDHDSCVGLHRSDPVRRVRQLGDGAASHLRAGGIAHAYAIGAVFGWRNLLRQHVRRQPVVRRLWQLVVRRVRQPGWRPSGVRGRRCGCSVRRAL